SRAETPDEANAVERAEALRLAAETEGSFGRYEEAINFRASLSEEKSDDYANRVELARLLAAAGRREEALAQLSKVISDRPSPRPIVRRRAPTFSRRSARTKSRRSTN